MKKHALILFLLVFLFHHSKGQDALLFNPYGNPLWLNPAFTGGSQGPAIYATNRTDAVGFKLNRFKYNRFFLAADLPVDKLNGGLGILFSDERLGDLTGENTYYITFGKSLNLNDRLTLRMGMKAGIIHSRISDWILFDGALPPRGYILPYMRPERDVVVKPDFGAGMILSSDKFDFGLAFDHLNRPDMSFYSYRTPLSILSSAHGSYTFGSDKFSVTPNFVYRFQAGFHLFTTGAYGKYKIFIAGLNFYPYELDRISALAGVTVKGLKLAYSYNSFAALSSFGAHELMIRATLKPKKERSKLRAAHTAF